MSVRTFVGRIALILLAAQAVFVSEARAEDRGGDLKIIYRCKSNTGRDFAVVDSCPPGSTEIEHFHGTVYPDGRYESTAKPVDLSIQSLPAQPASAAPPEARRSIRDSIASRMKDSRASLLRALGIALLFGVIAKLRDRSFIFWFLMGLFTDVALVGAGVFQF